MELLFHNRFLILKKTLHASEQEREDVQQAQKPGGTRCPRCKSKSSSSSMKPDIDEHDATLRARPRGQRCLDSAPHRALGDNDLCRRPAPGRRLTAPMVTDGPMDGETFLAYVHQFLCPTLQRRHRDSRQSQQSQGDGRSAESNRRDRSHPALSAPLLSGSESDRKVLFQTCFSRRCFAKPPDAISILSGRKSGSCSIRSPQANAQTTSPPVDM